jgi:hypothetical protein
MISCRGVARPVHWFCSCLRRSLISARPVAVAVLLLESLPPVLFDLPPGVLSVRIPAQVFAPVLSVPTKSFFSVARSALLFHGACILFFFEVGFFASRSRVLLPSGAS